MRSAAHIHAVNEGGWVVSAGDGEQRIIMDYPAPGGDSKLVGLTPLKVLLAITASYCIVVE